MEEAVFRVTAIERQKRNPSRVSVYLDGAFAFGIDDEVLFRHPIHEGDALRESFVDEVLLSDERVRAKAKSLRLLGRRALTAAELRDRLEDKDFSDRVIRLVIGDLSAVGLLNDAAFAESFVHDRMMLRPCSKRMLVIELVRKGLAEEEAARAVDASYGPKSEAEVAGDLALKKARSLAGEDPRRARQKTADFLFRRGFEWDIASEAVIRAVEGMGAGEEPAVDD
ncbi:regulatory protein RecX [bacterium]|nr:regulatory protein RecX [bacterium]